MIAGLDSSFDRPTPDVAEAAFAEGVRVWGAYLPPGVGFAAPWDLASVRVLQAAGMRVIGFGSGNDDPGQVAATAAAWGVLGCLDDEDGIRQGTGWQQGWLDASGFGLYGVHAVVNGQLTSRHVGIGARFHIAAWYPGTDPGATWPPGTWTPDTPTGWQWQGTHIEFGLSVDRSWLDDWFGTMKPPQTPLLEVPMTRDFTRPDGSLDTFELLASGVMIHTQTEPTNFRIVSRAQVPGVWLTIERAGIWTDPQTGQTELFVRGTGTDQRLWQATLGLQAGATWALGAAPIA
jgi:hypothetical protein